MHSPDSATTQTFVTVVETGSLSRAAERLENPTGAVSRRIAALEQRLGVRLLNRTTRKLSLTEAGQLYFEDAGNILRALAEAEDLAAGRLKSILAGYPGPVLTLWAMWPSRRFDPAKVRVFVDYLAEALVAPGPSPDGGGTGHYGAAA